MGAFFGSSYIPVMHAGVAGGRERERGGKFPSFVENYRYGSN